MWRGRCGEFAPVRVDPRTYYLGTEIEDTHRAEGPVITEQTAATRWRGERMDYDHGVMLLCHKAERGVSAETLGPPCCHGQVAVGYEPLIQVHVPPATRTPHRR
jgi:hypothetical protein